MAFADTLAYMEANPGGLAILVGQFPAINHGYLVEEIRLLREQGIRLAVASVSSADRPLEQLSAEEREEAEGTFYLKRQPLGKVLRALAVAGATRPLACIRGLWWATKLAYSAGAPAKAGFYFAEAALVVEWMRRAGASHLHTHFSASIGLIAKMIYPITYSFTAHGYGELYDPSAFRLGDKIRHALFVRAISQYGRSQMMLAVSADSWDKLIYCPLGVDCQKAGPAKDRRRTSDGFEIACVGRLAPEKGQVFLLRALAKLLEGGRAAHVHFYGDGPDRRKLEMLAESLGVASAVTFHGWTAPGELRGEYERMDCVVVPSLYEGIPIVLMEAMIAGIPCIAPQIAGIPELIRDRETGILFPPSDHRELAGAIMRLMDSPSLQASLAVCGRKYVFEKYDIARNTAALANLLRQQLPDLRAAAPYEMSGSLPA